MDRGAISRADILATIQECDDLGTETFLSHYGYKEARKYKIFYSGREYDSKAIAGVAHKHRQGRPLRPDEFSGGLGHAVDWLKREGFTIGVSRSPKWTRDELILACDVVAQNGWEGLSDTDPRIAELSSLLQALGAYPPEERAAEYRNASGCALKTWNIATVHPDHRGSTSHGGKLDRVVLQDFLDRPAEMAQAAQLLREGLQAGTLLHVPLDNDDEDDDEASAPEGRVLYARHCRRERSKALRKKKIAAVLKKGGSLACEACGFDFEEVYGERGRGYIECHHVVPLHEAGEGTTKLSDLALICSNCHRMIHRRAPWPTPESLRAAINRPGSSRRPVSPQG